MPNIETNGQDLPEIIVDTPHVSSEAAKEERSPYFFEFEKRYSALDNQVVKQFQFHLVDTQQISDTTLNAAKDALERVRLKAFQIIILKVINFVVKIFNSKFNKIDKLLRADALSKLLIKKYDQILLPQNASYQSLNEWRYLTEKDVSKMVRVGLCHLQKNQFLQMLMILVTFKSQLHERDVSKESLLQTLASMPAYMRNALSELVKVRYECSLSDNPFILLEEDCKQVTLIDQLKGLLEEQISAYSKLVDLENSAENNAEEERQRLISKIEGNDNLFNELSTGIQASEKDTLYDISTARIAKKLPQSAIEKPITVTMLGAEFTGLAKVGGLAEALEGMAKGMKADNPENTVRLIFPKYSNLPESIVSQFTSCETHISSKGEAYKVHRATLWNIECYFIEHPHFELDSKNASIYEAKDPVIAQRRFATYSELGADLLYEQRDSTDIIHLHDWHVAGVALKLQKEHREEWTSGEIPPIVFTYHNNGRGTAQGRVSGGAYSYDPVVKGYHEAGIIDDNGDNLFVRTLLTADSVTTVSEGFAVETQQEELGEGVSFAVRHAAKVGKLAGIINGANPHSWNPETNGVLKNWKDLDTQEPMDLTYGPNHPDIIGQRNKARAQLQRWVELYKPTKIDFSKPIVTYVGRFDAYQKGLDKFEEAIDATLAAGGQFIVMGTEETQEAKEILNKLEKKYASTGGVLFIRDRKENNKFYYQQGHTRKGLDGETEVPGMGPLVRAVSDFIFAPSRYEPCGLVQFEGWLFGSLAIGSETGGLADTIIPPSKDSSKFNGFLFKREGNSKRSATSVITEALTFWQNQSDEQKTETIKRLITTGRKYGWTSSVEGLTPIQKYRFSYAQAKERVKHRQSAAGEFDVIESLRNRVLTPEKSRKRDSIKAKEEHYLRQLYIQGADSDTLEKLYLDLPEWLRQMVPSPYGNNLNSSNYQKYGSFFSEEGTSFKVLAPNAKKVTLVLVSEDESASSEVEMSKNEAGEWSVVKNALQPGQRYQYRIDGKIKIDPYGRQQARSSDPSKPPYSVVVDSNYEWSDKSWMEKRARQAGCDKPLSVYEMHPLSWKRATDGQPMSYRELAPMLVKHLKEHKYTHVELMGILEHPVQESWGYQVTGYFAPTSRMGSVDDFKYLVDYLHTNNIGVILDWVPNHFAVDEYSLKEFDGSNMFEPAGLKHHLGHRKKWFGDNFGSRLFDYTKKTSREFLLSSAEFWLKEMHIDGIRVDCLSGILSTTDNIPGMKIIKKFLDSIHKTERRAAELFLRQFNAVVHRNASGAVSIAEDYSGHNLMTAPYHRGGLNFDMKWHTGWVHKTMEFFRRHPKQRTKSYDEVRQAIMSDNFNRQIVFFSHDQVKAEEWGALIDHTPGLENSSMRYANLRALFSFMMCSPGKKLLFMGNEYALGTPWDQFVSQKPGSPGEKKGFLDTLPKEEQNQVSKMLSDLNALYRAERGLHEKDVNGADIEWIEDPSKQIHAYRRQSRDGLSSYSCLHNFSDTEVKEFEIEIEVSGQLLIAPEEAFNSDKDVYGGQNRVNSTINYEEITLKEIVSIENISPEKLKRYINDNLAVKIEEDLYEITRTMLKYKVSVPPLSTVVVQELLSNSTQSFNCTPASIDEILFSSPGAA